MYSFAFVGASERAETVHRTPARIIIRIQLPILLENKTHLNSDTLNSSCIEHVRIIVSVSSYQSSRFGQEKTQL